MLFFLRQVDARNAGFRPCKRCRPDQFSARLDQDGELVRALAEQIRSAPQRSLATHHFWRHWTRQDMPYWTRLNSPIGPLTITVDDGGALIGIDLRGAPGSGRKQPQRCREPAEQLEEYFAGQRRQFDLPVRAGGSDFQQAVWRALGDIPFGTAVSYGELARRLGRPGAARAVGQANGANPVPIVVPCHRVIASDGGMGGFSGGLSIKRWLLAHEGTLEPQLI